MSKDSNSKVKAKGRSPSRCVTYQIVIPKFDNEGHRLSTQELQAIADRMTKHFGGITIDPKVLGCYLDEGETVCDENTIYTSIRIGSTPAHAAHDRAFMEALAEEVGVRFGQESVMTTIEDDPDSVQFVVGKKKQAVTKKMREQDYFKQLVD